MGYGAVVYRNCRDLPELQGRELEIDDTGGELVTIDGQYPSDLGMETEAARLDVGNSAGAAYCARAAHEAGVPWDSMLIGRLCRRSDAPKDRDVIEVKHLPQLAGELEILAAAGHGDAYLDDFVVGTRRLIAAAKREQNPIILC